MPRPFPTQPHLEHFRKQAKQLLRDVRARNADALSRARRSHPRAADADDVTRGFSLHDAQLVVAREFGFASWRRLQDAVARRQGGADGERHALVTGGAGFVGSHLVEALLARGHRVTVLDDLSAGTRVNVAHLADDPRFELVVGDICDADLVDRLVADADEVYHLAAVIGAPVRDVDRVTLWRTNVDGSDVVADAASRHDRRYLLASTSAVYGKTGCATGERETLREEDDLVFGAADDGGGWDYALSKAAVEQRTWAHVERHGLRATILRLFNVVGPRAQGTAVPTFLAQARRGEPLTVHGDGSHRRCFTDVRDVVEGVVRLGACDDACGLAVNLGSRNDLSIERLAGMVKRVTRSDAPVAHIPLEDVPFGQVQRHIPWKTPCLDRARQLVGYAAAHTIDESLHEIAALEDGGAPLEA